MNVELFKQVTDAIEAGREGFTFNMVNWKQTTGCGTTMCFAGWTVFLAKPEVFKTIDKWDIEDVAKELLNLDETDAFYLFLGKWRRHSQDLDDITVEEAVAYFRNCIEAKEIVFNG